MTNNIGENFRGTNNQSTWHPCQKRHIKFSHVVSHGSVHPYFPNSPGPGIENFICRYISQLPVALDLPDSHGTGLPKFPWCWILRNPVGLYFQIPVALDVPNCRGVIFIQIHVAPDLPNSRGAGFAKSPWRWTSKFPWCYIS